MGEIVVWMFIGMASFFCMSFCLVASFVAKKKKTGNTKKYLKSAGIYLIVLIIAATLDGRNDKEKAATVAQEEARVKEEAKLKEQYKEAQKEKEEAEAKKKQVAEAKKKEERTAKIAAFQIASQQLISDSKGIIPNITIEDAGSYLSVKVFVDEVTWAGSNESEKLSFATTVGTSIEKALAPESTYVDIMSATNNDVVATQKLFGGWKIKR
jgi:hypothetical protein